MADSFRIPPLPMLALLLFLSPPTAGAADHPETAPQPPVLAPETPTAAPDAPPLQRLDPAPPLDWPAAPPDLPPPESDAPGADSASWSPPVSDARLHDGLDWAFCGPRPGATGAPLPPSADDRRLPVEFAGDDLDYDRAADVVRLWGGVEIRQGEQCITADRAAFDRAHDRIHVAGQVLMESPGIRLAGAAADYHPESRRGGIEQARVRLWDAANLRASAARAWLDSETVSRYRDVRYTTCPPGRDDWTLQARELELDRADGLGKARHVSIRLGAVPVFYTPVLHFPIDNRRRSGLLIPTIGSSDDTGLDLALPYYWNIAPNLDLTLTPRLMSRRGLMLGTEVRHLTHFQKLRIDTELLPEDRQEPDEGARGALRIEQTGWLGTRWSSNLDIAAVSDDRYLQDFGNRLDVTSVRNLAQRGDLRYGGDGWRFLTRIQQFQTVDDGIAPADRPYGQLPHLAFDLNPRALTGRPDTPLPLLQFGFSGQYDYFDHNARVHGSRLVAVPMVRMPLRRPFGSLVPRARLFQTAYDLADPADGQEARQSYLIPSLDLDGGLILERETAWLGQAALQTLEPRLYYVFTGFEDQSAAPRFDTTTLDFSFASLFRANRFTGYDRIGDENRLTLGLTTRTLAHATGRELARASLGQVYYFDDRRVQLDDTLADETSRSSVAGELAFQPLPAWSARASAQWNPDDTSAPWEKRVLQLRYMPGDDRIVNLAYRFNLGTAPELGYEDTDLAFRVPLGRQIRLVGRWLYSLRNDETVEAFAGIEFGRCCWRLRLLGQHLKTDRDAGGSTSVMLQLELAGLGRFGNSIDKLLERGIQGYRADGFANTAE